MPLEPCARVGWGHRLAEAEVVRAVQRGQDPGSAVDLLEVLQVVLGPQVHPALSVRPVVRLRPGQDVHRRPERRADLVDGTILPREVGEERGEVAVAQVAVEGDLPQRDGRDGLGEPGPPQQRAGDVVRYRLGDRPPDQVHPADEIDALLGLLVELEDEAEDVTGVDQADDDDVSRVGNLVVEDRPADACLDELDGGALTRAAEHIGLPHGVCQRPEVTLVVLEDAQVDEALKRQVDDRFGLGREPLDPVLGVVLRRLVRDLPQHGVEDGIIRSRPVQDDQRLHIGVDAADQ